MKKSEVVKAIEEGRLLLHKGSKYDRYGSPVRPLEVNAPNQWRSRGSLARSASTNNVRVELLQADGTPYPTQQIRVEPLSQLFDVEPIEAIKATKAEEVAAERRRRREQQARFHESEALKALAATVGLPESVVGTAAYSNSVQIRLDPAQFRALVERVS
jgi:hypothetical protein